jgi:putative transposase
VVDTSLTAPRVVRELDCIIETRGCPRMIVSDNVLRRESSQQDGQQISGH